MKHKLALALFVLLLAITAAFSQLHYTGNNKPIGGPGPNFSHLRYPFRTIHNEPIGGPGGRKEIYPKSGKVVELCPLTNCLTNGISGINSPNPVGRYIDVGDNPVFIIHAFTSGGGTLLTLIEHSADDGQTWSYILNSSITATGTYYVPLSTLSGIETTLTPTPGSPTLTWQGPIGNKFRMECYTVSATSPWQFEVMVHTGSHNNLR